MTWQDLTREKRLPEKFIRHNLQWPLKCITCSMSADKTLDNDEQEKKQTVNERNIGLPKHETKSLILSC